MFDVQFSYRTLASLKVRHTYYARQESADFTMIPTSRSLALAAKMGILLKTDETGMHFLYDATRLEALLYYLQHYNALKFSFWIHTSNPYFISITNLPPENRDTLLYFNNRQVYQIKTKEIRLHTKEFVTGADSYAVRKAIYGLKNQNKEAAVELWDEDDQVLMEGLAKPGATFSFNLNNLTEGKYRIFVNKKEHERFIYLGAKPALKAIALVDIFFTGSLKQEIIRSISTEDTVPYYSYQICFETRSTYWKYFIVPKYNNGLKNTSIVSSDANVSFKGPEQVLLANSEAAFMFQSEEVLPLREFSPYVFQLRKSKNTEENNGRIISNRLPFPGMGPIKPESRSDTSKVYSEIIVYI